MNFLKHTLILTCALLVSGACLADPGKKVRKKPKIQKPLFAEKAMDHSDLNRVYMDMNMFIDEKKVSILPREIKIKRLKRYKNSLIS